MLVKSTHICFKSIKLIFNKNVADSKGKLLFIQKLYLSLMKYLLKTIGVFLISLSIILALFDLLIDNKEFLFISGIVSIIVSYFWKNLN